jgi:hypothetical protein
MCDYVNLSIDFDDTDVANDNFVGKLCIPFWGYVNLRTYMYSMCAKIGANLENVHWTHNLLLIHAICMQGGNSPKIATFLS